MRGVRFDNLLILGLAAHDEPVRHDHIAFANHSLWPSTTTRSAIWPNYQYFCIAFKPRRNANARFPAKV